MVQLFRYQYANIESSLVANLNVAKKIENSRSKSFFELMVLTEQKQPSSTEILYWF